MIEGLPAEASYQLGATLSTGGKILQKQIFVPSHPDGELEIVVEDR